MAQAVEVDVGAGIDGHQGLVAGAFALHVALDPGHRQGAGRLGDGAGVVVDVLDRRADLIAAHCQYFIDEMPADLEVVRADLRHRHPIGEQPDLAEHHAFAGGQRGLQAVGVLRLDTDHLHFRAQVFHVRGDAGDQAAAPYRHEDGVQPAGVLAEDFHGHRALAGDHVRIVVGRHESQALLLRQLQRVGQGIGEGVAVQHHLAASGAYALHLEFRRGARHHDGGLHPQLPRGQGQALGVVAGGGGDHPAGALFLAQLHHPVVGAADLEGIDRLQVLALEQHLVAQPLAELAGGLQGRFDGHVVHWRGEDLAHVVLEQAFAPIQRALGEGVGGSGGEGGHAGLLVLIFSPRRQKEETRLEGGFLFGRRLTRHCWNGGNNRGAGQPRGFSHGRQNRGARSFRSSTNFIPAALGRSFRRGPVPTAARPRPGSFAGSH
ncbi:hypothetical protein D9M70_418150 [compost metagenome]